MAPPVLVGKLERPHLETWLTADHSPPPPWRGLLRQGMDAAHLTACDRPV